MNLGSGEGVSGLTTIIPEELIFKRCIFWPYLIVFINEGEIIQLSALIYVYHYMIMVALF
jgi:hypothetical protein